MDSSANNYDSSASYDNGSCSYVCGDFLVGAGEACDDGNLASGDGCSATCTSEAAACPCGDRAAVLAYADLLLQPDSEGFCSNDWDYSYYRRNADCVDFEFGYCFRYSKDFFFSTSIESGGQRYCLFNYSNDANFTSVSTGWTLVNEAEFATCGAIVTELNTTRECN